MCIIDLSEKKERPFNAENKLLQACENRRPNVQNARLPSGIVNVNQYCLQINCEQK